MAQPRALLVGELEPAAEEVRADDQQVVAQRVGDPLVRRAAAEHRLRDERVHDDEHAEREREHVPQVRARERQCTPLRDDERERREQQHLFPRGDRA